MLSRTTLRTLIAALAVLAVTAGLVVADDRVLLRAEGAPANVLVIVDSGASMTHDPETNSLNFLAAGDDDGRLADFMESHYGSAYLEGLLGSGYRMALERGSKLPQAKRALRAFFNSGFEFNYGFSYYQKTAISIGYLDYVYAVKEMVDSDGDGVDDTPQPAMLNGTQPGMPMRMGRAEEMRSNANPPTIFPVRYGEDGDEVVVEDSDPFGTNGVFKTMPPPKKPKPTETPTPEPTATPTPIGGEPTPTPTPTPPPTIGGALRLVSFLVNGPDPATAVPLYSLTPDQRRAQHMYYYPAYWWGENNAASTGISFTHGVREALQGLQTWEHVATTNGIDTANPNWKRTIHDYVIEDITMQGDPWGLPLGTLTDSNQIGSRTLYVMERIEVFDEATGVWLPASAAECPGGCPAPQVTQLEYVQHFVLYDHPYDDDPPTSDTFSALNYQGTADCVGYLDEGGAEPIVPISQPDPATGAVPDKRWLIDSYLDPQTEPVFYFPHMTPKFLPTVRDDYIPLTETIAAIGRRPIKDSINEAKFYFEQVVENWEDPLANCRMNFVILITDGIETCSNTTAPCSAASNIAPIPVYVIYFGSDANALNPDMSVVECVADNSGGQYYQAGNEQEMIAALMQIAMDIEERTRGFASPIVPSVETTTEQTAYISTFTPKDGRSIWRGHLRAYKIDPYTGIIQGLRVDGTPNPLLANWDAGDTLAFRPSVERNVYFGMDDPAFTVPNLRVPFTYPTGSASDDVDKREYLGERILYPAAWLDASGNESDELKAKLESTINFIRGDELERDPADAANILHYGRDPDLYGWCAVTGDVNDGDADPCEVPGAVVLGIEKLGDVFHSTPQLMARPACFECWFQNLWGYRDNPATVDEDDGFIFTHKYRRQVIFSGADDGSLHAFDAGLWDPDGGIVGGEEQDPRYDHGSGRELFAFVPEAVMNTLDTLAFGVDHRWTVDSTPTIADVFIDTSFQGAPTLADREWRSVVLFGERRGGRSYVALDVTQPDGYDGTGMPLVTGDLTLDAWTEAQSVSRDPLCVTSGAANCSGEWPRYMWEFTDTDATGVLRDEDGNFEADLGQTWSRPLVGFVWVNNAGAREARMVAFVGGGFSVGGVYTLDVTGNFIYGIDIESGQILFKYHVQGMVPGEVSAVDINLDGFLEQIYFATTAGYVYKIDLTTDGQLGNVTVNGNTEVRVVNWTPQPIFVASAGQPFFMRPTLVPISFNPDGSAVVAVVIGSGNRDDIMEANVIPHRFYVFVDRLKLDGGGNPIPVTELDLVGFTLDTFAANTDNFLDGNDEYGWYIELSDIDVITDDWEKVNTAALVLEGFAIFSTFNPSSTVVEVPIYDDDGNVIGYACRRGGNARTYVVNLYNGNPEDGEARYIQHDSATAMATEPVVYLGADGKIHVIQALDNLKMEEPVGAKNVNVRAVNWKEQ